MIVESWHGAAGRFPTCTGTPRGASRRAIPGRRRAARPPAQATRPRPRASPEPSSSNARVITGELNP
jgi:hypothetical protein